MIRLSNQPNGGVVVFDKNGKLLRGIPTGGGKFILPEAERRSWNERRTGTERRKAERRARIAGQRRKFQERRQQERRTGKDRRAPPEDRQENRF